MRSAKRNTDATVPRDPEADPTTKRSVANRPAMHTALGRFLAWRGRSGDLPTAEEVRSYLEDQVAIHGRRPAHADFAYLQMAAAGHWGTEPTAFFARVLREHRVTPKPRPRTEWERAEVAIARLPAAWQAPMLGLLERSRKPGLGQKGLIWSASRLQSVAAALARWSGYCAETGTDPRPTGSSLLAYAEHLRESGRIGANSVADLLERTLSGYHDVIAGTAPSPGASFVVRRCREARTAPTTKAAAQIVGASAIYELGHRLVEEARHLPTRSTEAAIRARDGILLMLAVALPERARALSALAFGDTLEIGARPDIMIALPGEVLKGSQARKASRRRRAIIGNASLWDALVEYRSAFRPVFDSGNALFPSKQALGQPLVEKSLSRIVGRLTEEEFGTRVSLHRIRDNVATEAVEELKNGLAVAAGVLGHRDARTTARHYDRAQGRAAMSTVATLVAERRGQSTRLRV